MKLWSSSQSFKTRELANPSKKAQQTKLENWQFPKLQTEMFLSRRPISGFFNSRKSVVHILFLIQSESGGEACFLID